MRLRAYEELVRSEAAADRYLRGFCWSGGGPLCPECRAPEPSLLKDGRMRCFCCGQRFHDLTGRWLGCCRISSRQWLRLVKLFELEVCTRAAERQLELSYNTILRAMHVLRLALLASEPGGSAFFDIRSPFRFAAGNGDGGGRGRNFRPQGPPPVLGVREEREPKSRAATVRLEALPGLSAEDVGHLGLPLWRTGSLRGTGRYRDYDFLFFACPSGARAARGRTRRKGSLNPVCGGSDVMDIRDAEAAVPSASGFWSFARPRLARYNGVAPHYFPLYAAEMAFRFNRRGGGLFRGALSALAAFTPDVAQGGSALTPVKEAT